MKQWLDSAKAEFSGQKCMNKLKSYTMIAAIALKIGSPALRKQMKLAIKMCLKINLLTRWWKLIMPREGHRIIL